MSDVQSILLAYGIPSVEKQQLVDSAVDADQRQRLLDAQSRDDIYRVLSELAAVAKEKGEPYVHP